MQTIVCRLLNVVLLAIAVATPALALGERPDIAPDLEAARLAEAVEKLEAHLQEGEDPTARFQLGFVQFLQAIEGLSQDVYRYGVNPTSLSIPLFRFDLEPNPEPEAMGYEELRQVLVRFDEQLAAAHDTLAKIEGAKIEEGELKWTIDLDRVALDLNGDKQVGPRENLWAIFLQTQRMGRNPEQPQQLPPAPRLSLDTADVYWLRGYCHSLSSISDIMLAHDMRRLFELKGYLLFDGAKAPYPHVKQKEGNFSRTWIMDIIATIHLIEFDVAEPDRMKQAHTHMLEVLAMSRKSFEHVLAETDDDHEWIPSPEQTPVIPQAGLSREQINAWHELLDESEAILKGEKLIPFWRPGDDRGINLHRVFHEPQTFDLVLWVDGIGVLPYLEEGPVTSDETWNRFQRLFDNNLFGFSLWIN